MSRRLHITEANARALCKIGLDVDEVYTQAKGAGLDLFDWFERRWILHRDLVGLHATVWYCFFHHEPLPDWASLGVIDVIAEESKRRGDGLHEREQRHLRRWAKVEDLKKLPKEEFKRQFGDKRNLANIWRIAAEQMTAEGEPTSDEAIRKSCQAVARLFKAMARYQTK